MRWNKNPYSTIPPEMYDFYKQYKRHRKLMKLMTKEEEEKKKIAEEKKKKDEKKTGGISAAQAFMLLTFGWPFVGLFQLYLLSLALTQMSEALKLITK